MARIRTFCFLIAALATVSGSDSAIAATFAVTRQDDPFPNGCQDTDCSLREAVIAASTLTVEANAIVLAAGTYTMALGPLNVLANAKFVGVSRDSTLIEGNGTDPVFSAVTDQDVEFVNLEIDGHGAHALDTAATSVTNFSDARVATASEIWALGPTDAYGVLQFYRSDIRSMVNSGNSNATFFTSTALGLENSNGTQGAVIIAATVIDGSLDPTQPSGLTLRNHTDAYIQDTTIKNTTLGLRLLGTGAESVELERVNYMQNGAPVYVDQAATVAITDSDFSSNTATDSAPGALRINDPGADVTVTRSTFSNNNGNGSVGGAVLVESGGSLTLRNSTFSGNSFTVAAAAMNPRGAAIGFRDDANSTFVSLKHVTIAAPTVGPVGISGTTLGGYGSGASGLFVTVLNSVLQGSCSLDASAINSASGNVKTTEDTCQFGAGSNTLNATASSLKLGSLSLHGGHTRTFLPASTSVAIDTANSAFCLPTDQRSYARPFGNGCDAGAVEVSDIVFADGFE
ncbi:MAG: choice-of-anchor Q domain-containing protein [Dokdonella sp.]